MDAVKTGYPYELGAEDPFAMPPPVVPGVAQAEQRRFSEGGASAPRPRCDGGGEPTAEVPADVRHAQNALVWAQIEDDAESRDAFWGAAHAFDALLKALPTAHVETHVGSAFPTRGGPEPWKGTHTEGGAAGEFVTDSEEGGEKPLPPVQEVPPEGMGGPIPEDGLWLNGFWYTRQELLDAGWVDRVMIFKSVFLPSPPTPSVCCCPTGIKIVCGSPFGRYDLFLSPAEEELAPKAAGHSFDVVVTVDWLPSDKFRPCKLNWSERSNIVPRDWQAVRNEYVDLYAYQQNTRSGITSPTLAPWARIMDVENLGVDESGRVFRGAEARARGRQEAVAKRNEKIHESIASGGTQAIPLPDSPWYDGTSDLTDGRTYRDLRSEVIVTAGCEAGSACKKESLFAAWAQWVDFANGEVVASHFAQWPPYRWSSDCMAKPELSSYPNDTARTRKWRREKEREWRRRAADFR